MLNLFKYFRKQMIEAVIYRPGAGAYDYTGAWVSGTFTAIPTKILIPQPASGEMLKLIPEGEDVSKFMMTAVDPNLVISLGNSTTGPDEIVVDGERFEAAEVGRWGRYGGFDKVLLKRKGR